MKLFKRILRVLFFIAGCLLIISITMLIQLVLKNFITETWNNVSLVLTFIIQLFFVVYFAKKILK